MIKKLKVIKPFFVMQPGDTFELSKDEREYVSSYSEEYNGYNDKDALMSSRYCSDYTISPEYAEMLIENGYLAKAEDVKEKTSTFVNIFDEIDNMLEQYHEDLNNLDEDMAESPACLKVEKRTVLNNLITALNHLKNLKK